MNKEENGYKSTIQYLKKRYEHTKDYDISVALNLIKQLFEHLEEQKKLNEKHQKINGELREENREIKKKIKYYENPTNYFKYASKQVVDENKQLKEDLEDYDRIFDTFSKRKYAHRYLEERRKENPNLLCPDSDEIYQKYYESKDNWNKLKDWVYLNSDKPNIKLMLETMQELESSDSNE